MAERESSLAVLVDFENMARPGAKGRADFDIHLVLNRLAEKGRVIVKRAYADWSRYRDARHELMNAGLGLIEMPSALLERISLTPRIPLSSFSISIVTYVSMSSGETPSYVVVTIMCGIGISGKASRGNVR